MNGSKDGQTATTETGEQAEAERLAAEQAEADRLAAEQAEADRLAAEQAEADRLAAEQAEADRLAAEQAEADKGELVDPIEAGEDDTEEPPAAGLLGAPWWAVLLAVALLLVAYWLVLREAWQYVISADEKAERGDWAQLSGMLDVAEYLVTFLLGALLGVTVQNRQTQTARESSKKNQASSRKHRQAAARNEAAARKNKQVAKKQGGLVREGARELDRARRSLEEIQRDPGTSFAGPPRLRGRLVDDTSGAFKLVEGGAVSHVVLDSKDLRSRSAELEDVSTRLDAAAARLRERAI